MPLATGVFLTIMLAYVLGYIRGWHAHRKYKEKEGDEREPPSN